MDADEILKSEIPMESERKSSPQPPPSTLEETNVADVRLEEDEQTGQQAGFKSYENIQKQE